MHTLINSLLLAALFAWTASVVTAGFVDPNLELKFGEWVRQYGMKFQNDMHREDVLGKWISNHKFIETVNADTNRTYRLAHNQFSGMDVDEFGRFVRRGMPAASLWSAITQELRRLGFGTDNEDRKMRRKSLDLPASVDWVAKGAVTPVKDQGQCGSCWSFATTGALEGAYFNKYGTLVSFSEQQLVDCDNFKNGGKDHGCNGGLMDNAFAWIMQNNGLCKESSYPYVSGSTKTAGICQTCDEVWGSRPSKIVDVTPNSDSAMMTALSQQPVAVAIEADQREFQLYKSGVFTATCGTSLDHGVLVVGYGTEGANDYYKIKNSWGAGWGEGGFIRIGKGNEYNGGKGQCGVLMQASYVEL